MVREMMKSERRTKAAVKNQPIFVGKCLVVDPRVCHGQLTFRGTRVPVETILLRLARGRTLASLRKSWPEVSPEAIAEAVTLATGLLVENCRKNHA